MKLDSIYTIVVTFALNSMVKVAAVTALKPSLCKLNETWTATDTDRISKWHDLLANWKKPAVSSGKLILHWMSMG